MPRRQHRSSGKVDKTVYMDLGEVADALELSTHRIRQMWSGREFTSGKRIEGKIFITRAEISSIVKARAEKAAQKKALALLRKRRKVRGALDVVLLNCELIKPTRAHLQKILDSIPDE